MFVSGYPRKEATEQCASGRERNFRRHARRNRGDPGTHGASRGQRGGGTELEFDPWCSRWDAILFIVLIISEYIVRTRHAAPRSRIREIYAIETTPSPPLHRPLALNHPVPPPVCVSLHFILFPLPFSPPAGSPSRPRHPYACVDARNLCGIQVNELQQASRSRANSSREFRLAVVVSKTDPSLSCKNERRW